MQLIIPLSHIMMYQLLDCLEEREREGKKKKSKWTRKRGPPGHSKTKSSPIMIQEESFTKLELPGWHQTKSINKLINKILYFFGVLYKLQGKSAL